MSCCGKQRRQLAAPATSAAANTPATTAGTPAPRRDPPRHASVYFEYSGKTALTVVGPVSGKRYRFDQPGARVAVDPVDKPSLARVPHLRRVAGP